MPYQVWGEFLAQLTLPHVITMRKKEIIELQSLGYSHDNQIINSDIMSIDCEVSANIKFTTPFEVFLSTVPTDRNLRGTARRWDQR